MVRPLRCICLLALALNACGESEGSLSDPGGTAGAILVRITPLGNGIDPDGFAVSVGTRTTSANPTAPGIVADLRSGSYPVRLSGIAPHCFADTIERTVDVRPRDTLVVAFEVECYGDIAFTRHYRNDSLQVFYLRPDGVEVQLSSFPGRNFLEDWSPDGSRVLFTQERAGSMDVYSVRLDGTGVTRLTTHPYYDIAPRWSPDALRVLFYREKSLSGPFERASLHVVNADGTGEHTVLDTLAQDFDATWSPDGREILFSCNRFGRFWDICSVAPDGTQLRGRVRLDGAQKAQWSPDATHIAFVGFAGGQNVWVADLVASRLVNLTPTSSSFSFDWSPDGSRLVLVGKEPNGTDATLRVNRDGTASLGLSATFSSGWVDWSPDGSKIIADLLLSDGRRRAVIMNSDGSRKRVMDGLGSVAAYRFTWNPRSLPGKGLASSAMRSGFTIERPSAASRQSLPTDGLCIVAVGQRMMGRSCANATTR
jgi:dipeptidyl aminopeptidase/acylaminoacyl peptidase